MVVWIHMVDVSDVQQKLISVMQADNHPVGNPKRKV
jgi:hypothetical protein